MSKHNSFKKAWLSIALSTFFVSGSAACGVLYYFHQKELQAQDSSFNISTITQIGKDRGSLPTSYLAELLELSSEKKFNLISYNTALAEQQLLRSPFIKTVKVGKVKPSGLSIEYAVRKPYFKLANEENAAIDIEGFPVPITSFFKEDLPELVITEESLAKKEFVFKMLRRLRGVMQFNGLILKRVDLSNLAEKSLGKREIVLFLQERDTFLSWRLRLNPKNMERQIKNFFVLRERSNFSGEILLDLRVSNCAYYSVPFS